MIRLIEETSCHVTFKTNRQREPGKILGSIFPEISKVILEAGQAITETESLLIRGLINNT